MDALTQFPGTALLKAGLEKIGYTHEFLLIGGKSFSRYTSPSQNVWVTSNALLTYPMLTSTAKMISSDKRLSYDLADQLGAIIPYTYVVQADDALISFPKELLDKKPLIVKPNNASLSNGLTINITNETALAEAIRKAREFDQTVLVQQQVSGEEARFAVIDGECKAVILRRAARIVGDGEHSFRDLLQIENKEREQLILPYAVYPQLAEPIVDLANLDMSRIPADGEVIVLGKSAMIRRGASAYNITDSVHQSYKDMAEKLAYGLGKGFVVVDMFLHDFAAPITDANYAFLEYNMSPNLPLFYCCRDNNQFDVISDLIPLIDAAIDGKKGHSNGQD